jgi:hypothetical protein
MMLTLSSKNPRPTLHLWHNGPRQYFGLWLWSATSEGEPQISHGSPANTLSRNVGTTTGKGYILALRDRYEKSESFRPLVR